MVVMMGPAGHYVSLSDTTMPMPDSSLPPCLHALETLDWGPGLVLARCAYRAQAFDESAYTLAGIAAPATLESAVAKRRTEYLAGRLCARAALERVAGLRAIPEIGADRAPLWPAGTVGAITHSHGRAAALAGDGEHWRGLGLDAERWLAPARARRLGGEILTLKEQADLHSLADDDFARRVTRIFSIKESLFKALYPITGQRFYFQDAEMLARDCIVLRRTLSDAWPRGARLPVFWQDAEDGVLSWVTVPR